MDSNGVMEVMEWIFGKTYEAPSRFEVFASLLQCWVRVSSVTKIKSANFIVLYPVFFPSVFFPPHINDLCLLFADKSVMVQFRSCRCEGGPLSERPGR